MARDPTTNTPHITRPTASSLSLSGADLPLRMRVAHVGMRLVGLVMRDRTGTIVLWWGATLPPQVVVRRARVSAMMLADALVVAPPSAEPRVVVVRTAAVHQLPYFAILVADVVGELGLLEAGGGHALVAGCAATSATSRRRIG